MGRRHRSSRFCTVSLLLDSGSSNTWVGADPNKRFKATSSSVNTGQAVVGILPDIRTLTESDMVLQSVTYGSGDFSGEEFTDTVSIGPLTIKAQSIGTASQSDGFDGVDGILGWE